MTLPPSPTAAACLRCMGRGYQFAKGGEWARATACECVGQCGRCGGAGRLFVPRGGGIFAEACGCRGVQRRIALYNQARIPALFWRPGFETFEPKDGSSNAALSAVSSAVQLYPEVRKGFCLWSRRAGTGKTHLLCAALQHLALEKGVPVRYVESAVLVSEIKRGFQQNLAPLSIVQPLADVEVLAIDEIGKGLLTEFERTTIDELVSRRYNADRVTFFATNYLVDPKQNGTGGGFVDPARSARDRVEQEHLEDRIDARTFSRIVQMAHPIALESFDHRQVSAARPAARAPRSGSR